MRKLIFRATLGLALGCAACSNRDGLYPVSGKVAYKGSPAAGAVVSFHRRGGDPGQEPITGVVGTEGSFELVCGSLGRGAPPGTYDVLIEWKRAPNPSQRRSQIGPDRLRGRYSDPNHPRLSAEVKTTVNELPTFELTDY